MALEPPSYPPPTLPTTHNPQTPTHNPQFRTSRNLPQAKLGGTGAFFHHTMAASAWWAQVLVNIPTDAFAKELEVRK